MFCPVPSPLPLVGGHVAGSAPAPAPTPTPTPPGFGTLTSATTDMGAFGASTLAQSYDNDAATVYEATAGAGYIEFQFSGAGELREARFRSPTWGNGTESVRKVTLRYWDGSTWVDKGVQQTLAYPQAAGSVVSVDFGANTTISSSRWRLMIETAFGNALALAEVELATSIGGTDVLP